MRLKDQRGAALITVLALSGVALLIMAVLLHMITKWTSISGMVKSYATAREAAYGGIDVMTSTIGAVKAGKNSAEMPVRVTFNNFSSFSKKLLNATSEWGGLNSDVSIDAANTATYDINFTLGVYEVFGKVVHTAIGNTSDAGSGGHKLLITGVVNTVGGGGVSVAGIAIPSIHSVELLAQKISDSSERVKLSFVYEY